MSIAKAALAILLLPIALYLGDRDEDRESSVELQDFGVLPEYKLLFCCNEKAGSTSINKLLAAIAPVPNPQVPVWLQHRPTDYGLNEQDVMRILNDPFWVKAVSYRDPLERFLSAYRSKCEHFDTDIVCDMVFHNRNPSFAGAVRQLILNEDFTPDPHFYRQADLCTLRKNLPLFDEPFYLDQALAYNWITRVLAKAKVEITASVNRTLFTNFAPPGVAGIQTTHITHSAEIETLLHYYNHDCLIRLVVSHYQVDYSLFRLPYPDWAVGAIERVTLKECVEYIQTNHFG